ncbi:FHA domain-containing protein [Oculatella sp. LEGE 06141]|uniref:FHA domain-containing protein n=1 Tax=Oculatella sp. LEGE 06141 TaxID=1828648 RepID=UPI00187EFB83|nr:FHA domain-containing protein [Oculatella sp. LEGE 06141]MBE9181982.1 FHA domain-containing protein [Oculatella sp. LEGE 06141]
MKIKVLHSETQAETKELNLTHAIADGEECFVGRSPNSGLVLEGSNISRLHAKFWCQDGQYYFCDLGSSNGSMINGNLAIANQQHLLQLGDTLRIGDFVLLLEATSRPTEDLAETVVSGLDATVVTGYPGGTAPVDSTASSEPETEQVIHAELVNEESSAIVKVEVPEPEPEDDLQTQTKALFVAINARVVAELRAAGNLTRETYLKAIRNARESVEHNKLIDPVQFEKEAEKQWQFITKNTVRMGTQLGSVARQGAVQLGSRLGAAAKAAWREFLAPQSKPSQETAAEPPQPNPVPIEDTPQLQSQDEPEGVAETLQPQDKTADVPPSNLSEPES